MLAISIGRFHGVRPPYPAPELCIFSYPFFFGISVVNLYPSTNVLAFDELFLAFDRNFGYVGLVIGGLFRQTPVLEWLLTFVYISLMLAVALFFLALPSQTVRKKFVAAVALMGLLLVPLYALCPGAGPLYLLQDNFPWQVPDLLQPQARIIPPSVTVQGSRTVTMVPLNAAPSGHIAWALLMFWFSRKYCGRALQIACGIFLVLTCLATLGTGEHYLVDLFLAVPFTAGLWALVHRQWRFAGIALLVVILWLVGLREGWTLTMPPLLIWLSTGSIVAFFSLYDSDRQVALTPFASMDAAAPAIGHIANS